MKHFINRLRNFMGCEAGPAAVEYAVMLALIVLVSLAAIRTVGNNSKRTFKRVANSIAS